MSKILIISKDFLNNTVVGSKRVQYLADFLDKKNNIEPVILTKKNNDNMKEFDYKIYTFSEKNFKLNFGKIINIYQWFVKIIKVINNETDIKLIYFSGGPFYYFIIAPIIKFLYKINYILDFRDPWYLNVDKNIIYYLQKWSIINSLYSVNVTKKLTKKYIKLYPKINKNKFITIMNGYDERNLKKIKEKKERSYDKIKLAIFGKFAAYRKEDVDLLIKTINYLKQKMDIQVFQIGNYEKYFINKVQQYNLESNIKFLGPMNYYKGMNILSDMDCFILNNRSKNALGTKIFDYIYLNKPILAFVDDDYLIHHFLTDFNNYYNVRNFKKLKNALSEIHDKNLNCLDDYLEKDKYSRKEQFNKLYQYLKNILEE